MLAVLGTPQCRTVDPAAPFSDFAFADRTLTIAAESGTDPKSLTGLIDRTRQIHQGLLEHVLEPLGTNRAPSRPIQVWVFRSQKSYENFARKQSPIETEAHFARDTLRVHVAVSANDGTLRHELTHAILELYRPRAPYWIHEGLADFARFNPKHGSCQYPLAARLPLEQILILREHLQALRSHRPGLLPQAMLPAGLTCSARRATAHDRLLGAYLLLYLHQGKVFAEFLKTWRPGTDPEYALLLAHRKRVGRPGARTRSTPHGTSGGTCTELAIEFLEWFESDDSIEQKPGC